VGAPVAVDGNGRRESVVVECLRLCENGDDTNYRRVPAFVHVIMAMILTIVERLRLYT
jgi:hypothetical protein